MVAIRVMSRALGVSQQVKIDPRDKVSCVPNSPGYICNAWGDRGLRGPHRDIDIPMVHDRISISVEVRIRVVVPAGIAPIGFGKYRCSGVLNYGAIP